MYRPLRGGAVSVTAVAGLESLADSFVTAVGVCAGAAHLYLTRCAFAAVLIVDTVFHITLYTVDLVFFHSSHSFSRCDVIMCIFAENITGNIFLIDRSIL